MFEKARVKVLQARQLELEIVITDLMGKKNVLVDRVDELMIKNKRLGIKREMEEEQIAHKLKMREEACDLTNRKLLQTEKEECAKSIRGVKDKYRDKLETELKRRGNEIKSMYTEILGRLPKISVKGKI